MFFQGFSTSRARRYTEGTEYPGLSDADVAAAIFIYGA